MFSMPVRLQITSGTVADYQCADSLMEGISAKYLLVYRAYDTNQIIEKGTEAQIEAVIPAKRNRKRQREYTIKKSMKIGIK